MFQAFERFMAGLREQIDDFFADTEESATSWIRGFLRRRRVRMTMPGEVSEEDHKRAARDLETGREYYNKKRYKKAAKYFQRAATIDGRYGLAYYYLGLAFYKTDRPKGARSAWQRAIDVDPESEGAEKAREKLGNEKLGEKRKVTVAGVDTESKP